MTNLIRTALLAFGVLMLSSVAQAAQLKQPVPAPALTQTDPLAWLNSPPLSLEDLRGKVVLLDFWTFDCWNCYRSFPWLNSLEETFADDDFIVLGIHTPEFEHEKVRDNVAEKIAEFKLHHPVMMDNDFAYWRAMGNRYWPAFYILDKQGQVRSVYIGETHANTGQANAIEADIRRLLAES
ncbi:redoxin family protein [Aliamphritea spongicola]|uniref:redoxin family protein n=1 Tax=Aliamphritea spongicola TaxID=707589 RepID=UPI00196B1AA1|nr:redoxin family protein [Aliamphritea spongicola]MBN3564890.1 redoxin domain-containing protein [Aliamphritea spongicola]